MPHRCFEVEESSDLSFSTARVLGPPFWVPCPSMPRCQFSVPHIPTSALFPMAAWYCSARVSTIMAPGPRDHGSASLPSENRMMLSTTPWVLGNAPVPMVAWMGAVFDGFEPTVALSYQVPWGISPCRWGHIRGHRFSTYRPPASHTSTTTSLGWAPGTMASSMDSPSGALKSVNPASLATVGAMSAEVTERFTFPWARMTPGPYQNMGTSCV